MIAAICAGPIVLAKAGILKDKICTCSPGFETQLTGANYQEAIVQKDDHIITGKDVYKRQFLPFNKNIVSSSIF